MRESIRNKCELFVENYRELSKNFKWGYTINNKFGALLYTLEDRTVDIEAIKRCRKVIKDNTGVFSQFKDLTNFTVSVMLSLHSDPESLFRGVLTVYNNMKSEGFRSSHYLVMAATTLAQNAEPIDYQQLIYKAKEYYDAMKEEHPWITSYDDYGFASMMALANKPMSQTVRDIEYTYRILKDDFTNSNAVQALAEVLSFSPEENAAKCKRVYELNQALKRRGCKLGSGMEMSFLGVIALLMANTDTIADEIAEVAEYLQGKKGFGYWSSTNKERVLFAAALVCNDYMSSSNKALLEVTVNNHIIGLIIAQQTAAIAAASASVAAASASN